MAIINPYYQDHLETYRAMLNGSLAVAKLYMNSDNENGKKLAVQMAQDAEAYKKNNL